MRAAKVAFSLSVALLVAPSSCLPDLVSFTRTFFFPLFPKVRDPFVTVTRPESERTVAAKESLPAVSARIPFSVKPFEATVARSSLRTLFSARFTSLRSADFIVFTDACDADAPTGVSDAGAAGDSRNYEDGGHSKGGESFSHA